MSSPKERLIDATERLQGEAEVLHSFVGAVTRHPEQYDIELAKNEIQKSIGEIRSSLGEIEKVIR